MAAQSIVCQAMPVNRPAPSKAAPAQTGPLARPAGFSQVRRTVPYAFNPALTSFGDGMGVPIFVRPDCPPEDASSSAAAPKKEKRSKAAGPNARPQFRSALEQVSYMTNNKLWSDEEAEQAAQKFAPLRFLGL
ncbi:hypothetical protein CVIRNUC_002394 [Coccomyxa viridis]|uniref:Uncharacterized protein n=1 Tax=Coccomyxa viridis TaxID=1274662 RepID=A0AAV1HWR4_9CHLO|nr:hypothetical protein CVIRNUC_002394 [Coccomyxa viridis]